MKSPLALAGLAGLVCAAPVLGAEGGAIRGGEHNGFSRIVMELDPTTEWSLQSGDTRATIFIPGKTLEFNTQGVFEKLPRTRIQSVRAGSAQGGTLISVDIDCDCRVSTSFVRARFLALDVIDADHFPLAELAHPEMDSASDTDPVATAETETQAEREKREKSVVSDAEQVLLRQIERAASQGLINLNTPAETAEETAQGEPETSLAEAYPDFADTQPPEKPGRPGEFTSPTVPMALPKSPSRPQNAISAILDHNQVRATTVFDRYSALQAERLKKGAAPIDCIPDYRLDVGYWSDGRALFEQVPMLSARLIGEFDRPDAAIVTELAQLYIHFGFGVEAENLLTSFDVKTKDRALLTELARLVDGRRVSPFGPLARKSACPGRHGMWMAAGGVAPPFHGADHFATVKTAFADLPPGLRAMIGPPLIQNLLISQQADAAREIYDITIRSGMNHTEALKIAAAELKSESGEPVEAIRELSHLFEAGPQNPVDVLKSMVTLALEAGIAIPERTVTDLAAASLQYRKSEEEEILRGLLARTLASRHQLSEAVTEIRAAQADLGKTVALEAIAVDILSQARPENTSGAIYARVMLDASDLISRAPENDDERIAIASRLMSTGLPRAAEEFVAPMAERRADGRMLLAHAWLAQGRSEKVRDILTDSPADNSEIARLIAHSYVLDRNFPEAQAALDAAGLQEDATELAWPSGDWSRAGPAAADPDVEAMANFMAAQTGETDSPDPSDDPQILTPAEAFVEPLPQLTDPSLDSARRLLATGGQVEEFVQSILNDRPQSGH